MSDGWILSGKNLTYDEQAALQALKTVSTFNKDKWLDLARHYKQVGSLDKCEIAYLAARYCDIKDRDLMREWLAVYTLNRAEEKTRGELLDSANIINEALFDVVKSDERTLNEIQHLIFAIQNAEKSNDVV
jgi:hypothetical protein